MSAEIVVPTAPAAPTKPRTQRIGRSTRAGLKLSMARLVKTAQTNHKKLLSISPAGATAYAAVIETVMRRVIERACEAGLEAKGKNQKAARVTPSIIAQAIHQDADLRDLFGQGVFMQLYYVKTMETVELGKK